MKNRILIFSGIILLLGLNPIQLNAEKISSCTQCFWSNNLIIAQAIFNRDQALQYNRLIKEESENKRLEEQQERERQVKKEQAKKREEEQQERERQARKNALPQASLSWSKGDLTNAQSQLDKAIEHYPELLKFPLYHLKKPTFLNIGDTRRLVPDQETLLVNEADGKILYPYHDVAVDYANLTEGKRVDVTGECPQKGTLCSLNLKVTADLDLEHALLWGDKLPPQSTQIQFEPALSKIYTFTAEIPVDMAAQPFDLILTSRKGQSFKRILQLQGTQLQITAPKDLANEI